MARGDEEKDQIRLTARLEAKVEMLNIMLADKDVQIERLSKQVDALQEALVVKEAPELYRDRKHEEYESSLTPEQRQHMKDEQEQNGLLREYHDMLDRPIFESPDDLEALFNPLLIKVSEPGPSPELGYKDES